MKEIKSKILERLFF